MKIAIVGFGRFGQFWAKALKPLGEIVVFNRSDQSETAKKLGVKFFAFDKLREIESADIVFTCVAISATEEVMKKMAPFVKEDMIVADTCSVKMLPCNWLKNIFPKSETVGIHPMFGPDSAKHKTAGMHVAVCPIKISKANLRKLRGVFHKLKLKIFEVTPEEHDRQSAYSLALVHFLGRGLDRLRLGEIQIKTRGFEHLMELKDNVMHDSWRLFGDMQKFNPCARRVRQSFTRALREVDKQI
ncbi:MAG: prephenate dehydrogenase/arogenate dehydrogenase family protein [Candidatus Berkelbacteria bacterium]|nr:prephenate dehydrogenase/arogenate dehydrogenase family protein [Candidatus Berkelbacteria bacterium]